MCVGFTNLIKSMPEATIGNLDKAELTKILSTLLLEQLQHRDLAEPNASFVSQVLGK